MHHIKTAEHLLKIVISLPVPSSFFIVAPATVKPKNQHQDTTIQAVVNNNCSVPTYFSALVPITPTVSKIACGFNKETDIAKTICFFGFKLFPVSRLAGFDFQMEYPIYSRNIIPTIISPNRKPSNCKTMTDKPNTARTISKVSQIAAVIVAGKAFNKLGCVAPCEKIKTFCTPKGNISPNANKIPCNIASNFKNSLPLLV